MKSKPQPPEGFDTWLDYAIATMDIRSIENELLFRDDVDEVLSRDDIRKAVQDELDALKTAATRGRS